MIDKHIIVSGVRVRLQPYSEKRYKDFLAVQKEIDEYVKSNPDIMFDELMEKERKMVATWWKRKADILWDSPTPLSLSFFEAETFEVGLLKDTEAYFLASGQYL